VSQGFTSVLSNCVFCPVLFAGIDANMFFLAQSGLCFQRGSDYSVPFPKEKLDSYPYLVLNSCVWEEKVVADRCVVRYRYLFYLYFVRVGSVFSRWSQIRSFLSILKLCLFSPPERDTGLY